MARLVTTGRDELRPLRVEAHLGNFPLVSNEDRHARTGHRVVHTSCAVSRRRYQPAASGIKGDVEDLIIMSTQCVNQLSGLDIPDLARAINRPRDALSPLPVKLTAGNFAPVSLEGVKTAARSDVPQLGRVVKRARDELVASLVEAQAHYLGRMPKQRAQFRARLNVPELGSVVHGPCGNLVPLGVE